MAVVRNRDELKALAYDYIIKYNQFESLGDFIKSENLTNDNEDELRKLVHILLENFNRYVRI